MYIMDSLSLDSEINKKIGWAGLTFARITKRVWESRKSAVKYGHFSVKSMHSQHIALWQWHLETLFWMRADLQCAFYLCSPKQILDIKLMDWVNSAVKSSAAHRCLNSFTPLHQHHLTGRFWKTYCMSNWPRATSSSSVKETWGQWTWI